jgi:translation initiation factor IF-1
MTKHIFIHQNRGDGIWEIEFSNANTECKSDNGSNTSASELTGTTSQNAGMQTEATQLCVMPPKFKKLVWIKRGSFVIVQLLPPQSISKVRYEIVTILLEKQIKYLKSQKLWYVPQQENNQWGNFTISSKISIAPSF